ncbi:MAG: 50S ribosomal protein L3 [Chloroflexi bacterium]|nr:50S ribosomal protein L3 [Chloroflexota bacterium]
MVTGMIGRKLGMMRLYDGAGRARAVTVIELGPNRVTQLRTPERDGYAAVQLGFEAGRKRLTRAQRGHLRRARIDAPLGVLREFPANGDAAEVGEVVTVDTFSAGAYVNVTGVSKGRGFAGGVKRWNFRGGPKTHGQSDRHRAPGSVGAGTTPGKVWRGQHMAGHMGARTTTVMNVLVVLSDPARNLLFVEGSVPGPNTAVVTVMPGRRAPLKQYTPPTLVAPAELELHAAAPVAAEDELAEEMADDASADDIAADDANDGEARE